MVRWLSLLLSLWASSALADRVTVFAAASLRDALEAAADQFPGDVTFSFAGSSVLARQVAAGAPADIYISANAAWMDWLVDQDAVQHKTRRDVAEGDLVLIVNPDAASAGDPAALDRALGSERVAMALVDAVPAGIYGKQALTHLGIWDEVAPRVVQTDNVRAALALVALGETPFGIVYASDALAEPRVRILLRFEPEMHAPIRYPAALVRGADAHALSFLDHISSPDVQAIFSRFGFRTPGP